MKKHHDSDEYDSDYDLTEDDFGTFQFDEDYIVDDNDNDDYTWLEWQWIGLLLKIIRFKHWLYVNQGFIKIYGKIAGLIVLTIIPYLITRFLIDVGNTIAITISIFSTFLITMYISHLIQKKLRLISLMRNINQAFSNAVSQAYDDLIMNGERSKYYNTDNGDRKDD